MKKKDDNRLSCFLLLSLAVPAVQLLHMVEEDGSNQFFNWQVPVVTRRGEYPVLVVTKQQEMASVAPRFQPGVTKPEHFLAQL